jgi:hypothetical protein
MRRAVLSSLVSVVWCVSCASPGAKARGAKVVATSTPPAGCVALGPVRGSDRSIEVGKPWEYMQIAPSKQAATQDALERAGAMGATHATLAKPAPQDNGFYVEGMAYDCSSAAATPAPPPAADEAPPAATLGCGKDTDCKGDRICRNRECVDP